MKKLGFGLMRLPLLDEDDVSSINQELFNEMVDLFMKCGFTYFDTAYIYLKGNSEKSFKKAVVDRYPRDSFVVADKLPIFDLESTSQMQDVFEEQLERCGVDYFDYYLLHNVSTKHVSKFTDIDSFKFVRDMKACGKIKHIGISCHDTPEFLDNILTKHPEIEFVQLQINYLDWMDKNIQARNCYDIVCKHGLKVVIMEPLKGGALINVPHDVKGLFKNYDETRSVASWAMRFNLSLDNVLVILSGMKNMDDLQDNISTVDNFKGISKEESNILNKAVDIINDTSAIKCTSCNYCIDNCPANINISKFFELYNTQKLLNQSHSIAMYYRNYVSDSNHKKPSDCLKCNKCLDYCPQKLNIPDNLDKVGQLFE
ncbi:aldo/keto reductase [Methanosphaera sp. WGK6]|uniref:aldo/keto reductase n=1 Tax=Methanosphaera sp. WGK6 TaxID=1561964 RepID=UPI00084CA4BD|nr:aldo/keto reductase [Methanosphaera sp. WGK6]OED29547.1 Fe-S oxidoreductase [Methanosphaera sp. WGK6]